MTRGFREVSGRSDLLASDSSGSPSVALVEDWWRIGGGGWLWSGGLKDKVKEKAKHRWSWHDACLRLGVSNPETTRANS